MSRRVITLVPSETHHPPLSTRAIATAAAVYAAIGGAVSFAGWVFNIPRLYDWNADGINIKTNSSILITTAGIALLITVYRPSQKLVVRCIGGITAAVGILTVIQHLTGADFGIDTLLFDEPPGALATTSPNRMGVPASVSLSLIGICLLLITMGRNCRRAASVLGLLVLGYASFSLVGYYYGASQLYSIPGLTGVALQTSSMLAALGLAIVVTVPESGIGEVWSRQDGGGLMFRRLLLPLVFISLVLGMLRVMGQEAGLYDTAFGTAVRTILEISLMIGLLWITANQISRWNRRAHAAAKAVAEREERLRGVLNSLSDHSASLDADMRITFANDAAKRTWSEQGITDDVIGKNIFEVFPEAKDTAIGKALLRTHKERVPTVLEDHYKPFDRWYFTRSYPTDDGGTTVFALDITERKRAEKELERRVKELSGLYQLTDRLSRARGIEEVYEAALDTIVDVLGCDRASILLFDDAGVMNFVASRGLSDEYKAAVNGHTPWQPGEKDARPITIPDIKESDQPDDLKQVILAEGIRSLGFVPLVANGGVIGKFMLYCDEPRTFAESDLEIAMTIANQIAYGVQRTRAEAALKENEERLRLATTTGKVGIWDWDIRTDKITWTHSLYAMHGLRPGEFDGTAEGFTKLVHQEDAERVQAAIQRSLETLAPYEIEFRVVWPNGHVVWMFTHARVIEESGQPVRMIGASVDITERKKAEEEHSRLAAIVETSLDPIISQDLNGTITSWNQAAERLFGYSSEEAIGKPVSVLSPDGLTDESESILEKIRRGEKVRSFDSARRRKDGSLVEVSITVSPLFDGAGNVIGASKIARDITERKQVEAALREREIMHRLVDAQEAERHRIARDLHDHLGQQLTALRLKLEGLKTKANGHDGLIADIDETQRYASRIDVDINYLAWELMPTELEDLGLVDALRSFIREWSNAYQINADFHATAHQERYHPDIETNLYRITQEALNNIVKHAGARNVSVLLEQREDLLILIIEDDGKGFDYESKLKRAPVGKGFGLVGMRERTALLGGTLEIETRPGDGTTLYARVPVRQTPR